jgi:glyoxylase-like metal-dependent hydrolase (beta-lactamase superfamily II)
MTSYKRLYVLQVAILATIAVSPTAVARHRPGPPKSIRLYVFDNGTIKATEEFKRLNPELFKSRDPNVDFFTDTCYLIVHPKGTLMWDAGMILDSDMPADGSPITQGIRTGTKALKPRLAAAGYRPSDITYFAMSHYHSDHTANANDFASATWIVQQAERDWMFADQPKGNIRPFEYNKLKDSKTIILKNEDHDVFGDGSVIIISAPGHTPGHQVLFVNLAKTGPLMLAGDLYHYPEERTNGKVPPGDFDAAQTLASRAKIEAFVQQHKAKLWIEHDIATHANLKKAPDYIE